MHNVIVLVAALSLTGVSLNVPAYERAFDVSGNAWTDSLAEMLPTERLLLSGISDDFLGGKQVKLELERLRISDAESRVVLHGRNGVSQQPLPRRTYLHGEVAGEPGSRALLIIDQDGDLRGIVRRTNGMQSLQITPDGVSLVEVDTSKSTRPFQCDNSRFAEPPAATPRTSGTLSTIKQVPANGFLARIAFETDYEYFARFGNGDDAAAYAMDLIAFASTIYYSEASTRLALSAIHLWTDDAETDPWNQTDSFCGLLEFGKYWNDNRDGSRNADRTIAHFLSGKRNSSGVAWVGVLCRSDFSTNAPDSCNGFSGRSNYGGDYGYTSGIRGNFDLSNPTAIWDFVGVAHEMGHNFDSPHTHCYAGLEGGTTPIDQCHGSEDGCYSGATSLPGPRGEGSGTIMSYCHQLSGGMNNIGLTLGWNHPYGDTPERVPNRMMAAAIEAEENYPGCLTTELEPEPEPEPEPEVELTLSLDRTSVMEGESVVATVSLDRSTTVPVSIALRASTALNARIASGLATQIIAPGNTQTDFTVAFSDDNQVMQSRIGGTLAIDAVASSAETTLGSPSQILLEWKDNDVQAGHLMIDSFEGLSLQ